MAVDSTRCRGICEMIGSGLGVSASRAAPATITIATTSLIQLRCMPETSYTFRPACRRANFEDRGAHTSRLGSPEIYCPSGVVMSVPGGGLNSKVDGGTGARV